MSLGNAVKIINTNMKKKKIRATKVKKKGMFK